MSKHKAITKEETVLDHSNTTMESKFYLEHSAQPVRPSGMKYLGSLAVHVYASELQHSNELSFASHTDSTIPETVADLAIQDLREKAMKSYNRKQPRRVT